MIPCPDFKLQEVHLELENNFKDGNGTKMNVAKMKIEEKLRKEKRAKLLEKIRKPLVDTPGIAKSRGNCAFMLVANYSFLCPRDPSHFHLLIRSRSEYNLVIRLNEDFMFRPFSEH